MYIASKSRKHVYSLAMEGSLPLAERRIWWRPHDAGSHEPARQQRPRAGIPMVLSDGATRLSMALVMPQESLNPEWALADLKSSAYALPTRDGVTMIMVSSLISTMYLLVKLWSFDV